MDRVAGGAVVRPTTLLLTLLGRHVQHRDVAVSAATFIAVLARLNVSVDAARSTLARMVRRGYLHRHRHGRQVYFSLTAKAKCLLSEGEARIFESPPVRPAGEVRWTLLSFSIPEAQRRDRHSLRVALSWRGFGLLRDGLWLAPGRVDVAEMVAQLGLDSRIEVFVGQPASPTDLGRVIAEAWDLDGIRAGYLDFLARWSDGGTAAARGDLATQIRLITEWRLLLVDDPQLSISHLPPDWPATRAHDRFLELHERVSDGAQREFEQLFKAIALT